LLIPLYGSKITDVRLHMKIVAFIALVLTFFCLPVMAQNDEADGSSEAAAGCGRIQMGAGVETEGEDFGNGTDLSSSGGGALAAQSGTGVETTCEETLNDDGTLTCYINGAAVMCQVDSEYNVNCPEPDATAATQTQMQADCEEELNEDGTLTCYINGNAVMCEVQGEEVYCPEQ
jgi:hypothetical protein